MKTKEIIIDGQKYIVPNVFLDIRLKHPYVFQLLEVIKNLGQNKEQSTNDNTMENKIIGYCMKPEYKQYEKAAFIIADKNNEGWSVLGYDFSEDSRFAKRFREAGVLDLWFEPVYEEEKKPLFVTEDGKEIFINGRYWSVFAATFNGPHERLANDSSANWHREQNVIAFSTESAAKQYIYDNERVFSRKDIRDAEFTGETAATNTMCVYKQKLGL